VRRARQSTLFPYTTLFRSAANYLGKQPAMTFMMRILEGYIWHRQDAFYLLRLARNPYLLAALIYIYKNSPEGDLPRNAGLLFRQIGKHTSELQSRENLVCR